MYQGTWAIKNLLHKTLRLQLKVLSTCFCISCTLHKCIFTKHVGNSHQSKFQNIILDSNQPIQFYKRSRSLFYCPWYQNQITIYITSSFKILVTFGLPQSLRDVVLEFYTLHFRTLYIATNKSPLICRIQAFLLQLTNMPTNKSSVLAVLPS
jgi:hypothetical protein